MKKRTIIAAIITTFILFFTNNLWLNFKPMSVDFNISGKGICEIEVQLNNKNNDKFEEVKSLGKKINLGKTRHAQYKINQANFPKRLRLVFKNLNSPVEIKNITLKNGKYKIDNLSKFTLSEGRLAVTNNTIVITPPPRTLRLSLILKFSLL